MTLNLVSLSRDQMKSPSFGIRCKNKTMNALVESLFAHLPHRLVRDPRAGYKQSLAVLEQAKKSVPGMVTKSSIMLGCGETDQQVLQTLRGE